MYERPAGIENENIWIDGCFDFTHHGMFHKKAIDHQLFCKFHNFHTSETFHFELSY